MRMEKHVFYNLPFTSSFVFSTCFVNLTELEDAACRKSLNQIKQQRINWIFFVLIDKLSS